MSWIPLLRREVEDGHAHSSREWEGEDRGVLILVEPPRNALPAADYRRAQASLAKLHDEVQRYRPSPLPVGVQEDLWSDAQRYLLPPGRSPLPPGYLAGGGYGIVAAVAGADPPPAVLRLEDADSFARYKSLEQKTVDFMTRSAEFFRQLVAGYRDLEQRTYSPPLARFLSRRRAVAAGGLPWKVYLMELLETARRLGIEPTLASHRSLLLYEEVARLEADLDPAAVTRAKDDLKREIEARVQPDVLAARAALELALYNLLDRHAHDPAYEERIDHYRQLLAAPVLPPVPESFLRSVSATVTDATGDYLVEAIRIKPGEQDKPHKGHGELLSRLLELARVLGIDVTRYDALARYVYYIDRYHRMLDLSRHAVAGELLSRAGDLEAAILERLAGSPAERDLLDLDRTARFLEELGRYHLVHDDELRRTVNAFEAISVCERLIACGMPAPADWQARARDLDRDYPEVRRFFRETRLRGKRLTGSLLRHAGDGGASTAILWCEGYLLDAVTRSLEAEKVSYAAIVPRW